MCRSAAPIGPYERARRVCSGVISFRGGAGAAGEWRRRRLLEALGHPQIACCLASVCRRAPPKPDSIRKCRSHGRQNGRKHQGHRDVATVNPLALVPLLLLPLLPPIVLLLVRMAIGQRIGPCFNLVRTKRYGQDIPRSSGHSAGGARAHLGALGVRAEGSDPVDQGARLAAPHRLGRWLGAQGRADKFTAASDSQRVPPCD